MRRESGQGLVEAVAALPVCLVCALAIVDCGIVVRDRIAVSQAATRAAEAEMDGRDATAAAGLGLPGGLRASLRVSASGERVRVSATSRPRLLRVGGGIEHRSAATTSVEAAR